MGGAAEPLPLSIAYNFLIKIIFFTVVTQEMLKKDWKDRSRVNSPGLSGRELGGSVSSIHIAAHNSSLRVSDTLAPTVGTLALFRVPTALKEDPS